MGLIRASLLLFLSKRITFAFMTMLITKEDITRDNLRRKDTIIRLQCKGGHSLRG